ncbi:MFS transporter [Sinomonas cellulolyticus]|uniref:Aromatic acid/H+ symport family MFS transporter n=1 Tax=Sinomonas cellulolyticus TaxID=2801916 RepID=A0ABS1K6E6_9MICC|nr:MULTISPECIES: aromatic acid/H+ symport family MFS transporter [Sinomonas]MBL0707210.1 aromatic acid/H+ symport family MFS transporter [Sinomonas cellulolyticus]GHG50055.1 MFS transporter [Sinomonas sp. KCTC 49339]
MQFSTSSPGRGVQLLCWSSVALDGFDLIALAVVFPVLLKGNVWGLTAATASVIAMIGLVGMTVGAIVIGSVAERIGPAKALVASVACFSVFTLLSAAAPSAILFTILRFLAGVGLGGCMPIAVAIVAAHRAGQGKSSSATTTLMTGYNVGAVLCALLGMFLIPWLGWQSMFVAGALPALVLVPLMIRYLSDPDAQGTPAVPVARSGRASRATISGLFRGVQLRATLAFWIATFMGLLLIYGLNTWLPEIMRAAGYSVGNSLAFLLTLNLGAILGYLLGGRFADRGGVRRTTIGWFAGAAIFLAVFALPLPEPILYAALFLAGFFVFSSQALTYAYTQKVYPNHLRATGVGWTAGVGRLGAICGPLLGGVLLTAGIAYPWGFYVFAIVGVLGAAAAWIVPAQAPQQHKATDDLPVAIDLTPRGSGTV